MPEEETENINRSDIDFITRKSFVWALSFFVAVTIIITGLLLYVFSDDNLYYPRRLSSSLGVISIMHQDVASSGKLIEQARDAIFEELDKYSGYLEPGQLNRVTEELSGSYSGVGITVVQHERGLTIASVREGGPAEKAGLMPGDIITKVDDIELDTIRTYEASPLLRGKAGTSVRLSVEREDTDQPLEFVIIREKLKLIHIPYAGVTENNSFYVRIIDFESGLTEEFKNILDSIYYPNQDSIKSIILDVRGNPGGVLSEASAFSNLFLDSGHLIVGVKSRSIWTDREHYSTGEDIFDNLPVAIMIDYGSASAAEILAGALKYAKRAILVGDTTYGKGLVQQFFPLNDGSGIRLTTARYYFEGNIYINDPQAEIIDSAIGIPPDYYMASTAIEPFTRQLESSGLLRQFALDNDEEIIKYQPMSSNSIRWFSEFKNYASNQGFYYESNMTALAKFTRNEVKFNNYCDEIYNSIENIYRIAEKDDLAEFDSYKDYIISRLFQIALEAKKGTAAAYREAIIPFRREILSTEKILTEISSE